MSCEPRKEPRCNTARALFNVLRDVALVNVRLTRGTDKVNPRVIAFCLAELGAKKFDLGAIHQLAL